MTKLELLKKYMESESTTIKHYTEEYSIKPKSGFESQYNESLEKIGLLGILIYEQEKGMVL